MLQLKNIKKSYKMGDNVVEALKGINIEFRKSEFVSILGPSGCGKTTLLNIIGGLDRYDEGDLSINGKSTKEYTDKDWDAYRNHSIGFVFQSYNLKKALLECSNELKIVGILRLNETTGNGCLTTGVAYLNTFTDKMIEYRNTHPATLDTSVTTVSKISKDHPSSIALYVNSFEAKASVKAFIEQYNAQASNDDQITYSDYVDLIMSTVSTIINAITYVLIAFVSVSLIVSSIMIGIITYISVIERTKEIGVLRSVGASKRDVKRVFTAESFIIGLFSGILGIVVSLILILPINLVLQSFTGIWGLASLPILGSIILILISVALTFVAGLIPAQSAAKKDPVIALRANG